MPPYSVQSRGTFTPSNPFSLHLLLLSFLPYPRLSYPFCPCHNFISLHVISKLAPNEFLISPNSVAVAITFIVFSFTIPHIGGRVMLRVCVTEGERERNGETGKYVVRQKLGEKKRGLTRGGILAVYHPIFKFKMSTQMKVLKCVCWRSGW